MMSLAGHEPHAAGMSGKLNWLRAGVLGANDGIISTAGLVVGVAGATANSHTLLISGVAGGLAGALSMAVGEYVSVSTQRDTERALIALETRELADDPEGELEELIGLYEAKGLSPGLSREAAEQLTAGNALAAHLDAELGIDPDDLTNPWHAGIASFFAFLAGAAIPLLAILLSPTGLRLAVTMAAVLVGTGLTGFISAHLGRAPKPPAIVRNLIGGALVMAITYTVGTMIGGAAG
ncbi:MAG: VIT family protein [Thermoleophilia bacterium]|nr:VIT family protein [Thermoleophilia bacterium]